MNEALSKCEGPPIYDNSLYRRWIIRPLAKKISPILYKLGFSGNGVCWVKFAFGFMGALLLASKSAWIGFSGMLFLQVNFLLDAADGEVSRLRGEAGKLSGEFLDKLFDHLPKTAMYFFWGYGTFRLTGSHIPLFCGAFFAAWNIYPRFCGVETLLERLDKAPAVYEKSAFRRALAESFVVNQERGKADFMLTLFVHPAINLLTLFFIVELLISQVTIIETEISTRLVLLLIYTLVGLVNFLRKGTKFFKALDFS